MLTNYRALLGKFDWDGVNIAELYFEAGRGVNDPGLLTPFHPSAREQFKRLAGFDPVSLLNPASPHYWRRDRAALEQFNRYRVGSITQLHDAMLTMADTVRASRPGFDVVVTVLDNLAAPELKEYIGVDTVAIAGLMDHHEFVLQVEDPESMWSGDPRRYKEIARRYQELVPLDKLALDLNILMFRSERALTPFPTRIQTGTEAAWLLASASRGAPRVTVYSESSVNPQDLALMASAYSSGTNVAWSEEGLQLTTPTTLVVQLASSTDDVEIDGRRVHTIGRGRFLVPAGEHTIHEIAGALDAVGPDVPETHILSITGTLLAEHGSLRSVSFRYRSAQRCIVTLTRAPYAVLVDGKETAFTSLRGLGRSALVLPPGEHDALVVAESNVTYGVDITSFWSSYVIAVFGAVSTGLLLVLWVTVRVRHKLGRSV